MGEIVSWVWLNTYHSLLLQDEHLFIPTILLRTEGDNQPFSTDLARDEDMWNFASWPPDQLNPTARVWDFHRDTTIGWVLYNRMGYPNSRIVYSMENPIKISGNAQGVVFLPSDILACQVHLAKVKVHFGLRVWNNSLRCTWVSLKTKYPLVNIQKILKITLFNG